MRTSKVHHIAPSAISITPNANNSHRDLAVYLARDAKIKVYSPNAGIDTDEDTSNYQEWTLTGRNRRLADTTGTVPYTIYAKLSTVNKSAYLVFAAMTPQEGGEYMDAWTEAYSHVTTDGFYVYGKGTDWEEQRFKPNCMFVRLGDVSAAVNGQRTVTLDTGILGTDQYNEEWSQEPDDLPLRVELGCTIDDEDAGPTPYLYWGQSALLTARIVEGWTADASEKVHHWTISRRIGNEDVIVASSDSSSSSSSSSVEGEEWPGDARAALFNSSQTITLFHVSEENDDFISAAGGVFVVTAWGTDTRSVPDSSDSDSSSSDSDSSSSDSSTNQTDSSDSSAEETIYVPLGTASINIYVETNTVGTKGDSPLAIFRWYKDGLTPVRPIDTSSAEPAAAPTDHAGAGNVYPLSAWSKTSPNRPQEGEWALWMCTSTRHGNGIVDAWSDPVRISGTKGTPGEDAKEREWIYKLGNSSTLPSAPQTQSVVVDEEIVDGHTIDDYEPNGWEDNAQVISENQRFLYACWRDWNKTTNRWGDFQGPIFWSVWGERGIDGDGAQYIFKLFDHELSDAERENNRPSHIEQNEQGEWLPASDSSSSDSSSSDSSDGNDVNAGWHDDPPSSTPSLPYCYCSTIKRTNGMWGTYGKLALWSRYNTDGVSQPSYIKTQEAWSNSAVTASETTAPATAHGTTDGTQNHAAEQDWSDNTPSNPNHLPYLWRRSRQMVLNVQTRQYDYATGSWIYTRLNGTNGTSINTKGTVVYAVKANDTLPSASGYSVDDLLVRQGNATLYKLINNNGTLEWSQTGMTASADGDSYTVTRDCTIDLDGDGTGENIKGHLITWSAEAQKWIDLGQFKGDSGVTYYTHIAWAKIVTLGTPTTERSAGQQTTPNASSVSSASSNFSIGVPPANDSDEWPWMGWLVDHVATDSTNPLLYTWRNVLGPEGNGIASVTRTYARSSQSTSTNDETPPTGIDTTIGTNGWAATSPAVSEAYPYLWAKEVVVYTRHNVTTTKYYMIGARGQNGIDAQDAEWAYVRTNVNVAPEVVDDGNYTDSYSHGYIVDDHLPKVKVVATYDIRGNTHYDASGYKTEVVGSTTCHVAECTDDPQGVSAEWPYEWEIRRTKGNADANGHRTWDAYSGTMTLHNSLAESALVMDIDNDSDQFGVDADGKVITQQTRTTVATLLYGPVGQAFLNDAGNAPSATLKYDDGNAVPAAVAEITTASLGNSNKHFTVTVTIKANSATTFSKTGKNGLYVDITGSCAKGGPKSIRFSLTKVMSGASGEDPVIYQLAPSGKTFSFSRDALNELTPNARSVNVYVMRTVGNTTTKFISPTSPETLTNPPTFSWGFDTETTPQASSQAIGATIEISGTDAASHYQVWVQLSTGDRETLPIVKDGTNGATTYLADLDNEMDSISCDDTGYPVTQQTVSTPLHMYYGSGSIGFTVHSVTRNGTAVTLGSQSGGVTVSLNSGTLNVAYATTAQIQNGKDEYVITLHPSNVSSTDYSNDRVLTFTVNAIIGDVYNLNPSPNQIRVQNNATSFSGLTCGYKKNVNGAVSEHVLPNASTNDYYIDGKYNIYYRLRLKSDGTLGSTYTLYSGSASIASLNVATYDAVEFIICTNTSSTTTSPQNVIDRETVYVTYDGANGSSDMVQVTCVPGSLTVPFTSAGAVKELTQLTVTLGMTVNGNAATVTGITVSKSDNVDVYSSADTGYSALSDNQRCIVIPADGTVSKTDVNRGIVFTITGTYNSKSYTANYTFPMIASEQGGNGDNAVFLDLDNEMDSIPCDSTGTVMVNTTLTTHARIYTGAIPQTSGLTASAVSLAGKSSGTPNIDSNGVVTFSWAFTTADTLSDNRYTATVIVNHGGQAYTAVFTANVVKSGAPGVSPTIYNLNPTVDSVNFGRDSSNAFTPSSITVGCGLEKKVGNVRTYYEAGEALPSAENLKMMYRLVKADGTHVGVSGYTVSNNGSNNALDWAWMDTQSDNAHQENGVWASDNTVTIPAASGYVALEFAIISSNPYHDRLNVTEDLILDKERIPILYGGTNGDSPVVYTLQCTPSAVNFRSDAVGNFFGSYTVYCKVMKTIGDVTSEVTASDGTYDGMYLKHHELGASSGSYNSWAQASSISLNPGDAIESLLVATEFALATDSSMTHVVARAGVPITLDGRIGATGAAGRMFRPRGTYNDSATYVRNSEFVDLVFFDDGSTNNVNSARGHYYYVSEGKTSNVSGSTHYAPASTDGDGNSYNYQSGFWTLADDFAVVITQAVFAEYAKMGSAIMSGDYMYSAYANKDFVMLSTTMSKNGTSYTLIGNQTALEVRHGVQYNLVVNCEASSSSSSFFCRVYYLGSQYDPTESSNWSSHGIEGFHYFSTNSETYGDYALPFMAEYTGWVKLYSYGNGYVSRIAAKNIGDYTNVLPMFINNDAVNLLAYGAATTSSTSQASPGYLLHTPIPVRAGMSYRLDFNARVNTSGATFYIGVYDGNSRLDYVAVNSTTDTAFQIDFTANADGSVYIKGYTTSGSGVVSKLTITPQNPYVPTVAVNWLTGYAHFAGDNVRFNPDGSGKLAAGNITWDNVGNARFNGTLRANLFYSRTKWFDLESNENIIYNINPESEPYTSFGAKVGQQFYGTVSIRLPSAVAYDGIEFDFFSAPIIEDATTIIYVFPTNNDKLYVYRSGYTFMEVTCISPYKDRVKVKAYNGSWFIVEGTPAVTQ